jgi:gas vesicle protein
MMYVRTNLDHDLQGLAGDIQENIEENVRELENELKKELAEVRRERRQVRTELENAKNLMARVARLEENERLNSRVTTEKKY